MSALNSQIADIGDWPQHISLRHSGRSKERCEAAQTGIHAVTSERHSGPEFSISAAFLG